MEGNIITGFILLALGGLSIIRPDIILAIRIALAKKIYGAEYKPTRKTFQIQRIIGVMFASLGLLIVLGIL